MQGAVSLPLVVSALFLVWFVVYWIVGGVTFSVVSLTRFLHVHKARFSCLFTLMSAGAAYAAASLGARELARFSCIEKMRGFLDILFISTVCGTRHVLSAAFFCFFLLLLVGIVLMFVFRRADDYR